VTRGGADFVFCDAFVHFIGNGIEFNNAGYEAGRTNMTGVDLTQLGVYQKLGIRNDGQAVPADF
jgi:hypothetical protein